MQCSYRLFFVTNLFSKCEFSRDKLKSNNKSHVLESRSSFYWQRFSVNFGWMEFTTSFADLKRRWKVYAKTFYPFLVGSIALFLLFDHLSSLHYHNHRPNQQTVDPRLNQYFFFSFFHPFKR